MSLQQGFAMFQQEQGAINIRLAELSLCSNSILMSGKNGQELGRFLNSASFPLLSPKFNDFFSSLTLFYKEIVDTIPKKMLNHLDMFAELEKECLKNCEIGNESNFENGIHDSTKKDKILFYYKCLMAELEELDRGESNKNQRLLQA